MRRDCILAPIPAADYAKNSDKLVLVPDLSISSKGEVGSVLLFGMKEIATMESIALPSDSATSVTLLKFLIKHRKLDPKYIEMGPDLMGMLDKCDGCLLIGDRALEAARDYPELVRMDLGKERYFGEVINRMDPEDMTGLEQFLNNACQMQDKVKMAW